MADLSILDKLRFVASQQTLKKRNASNLVSLSQDSSASTQPLARQMSETTACSQAWISKPRPNKRTVTTLGSITIHPGKCASVCIQTDAWYPDNPPLSCDWISSCSVLSELHNVKQLISFLTDRFDLINASQPLGPPAVDSHVSELSTCSTVFVEDLMFVDAPIVLPSSASRTDTFVPSYQATVDLAKDIPTIPRPNRPATGPPEPISPTPPRASQVPDRERITRSRLASRSTQVAEVPERPKQDRKSRAATRSSLPKVTTDTSPQIVPPPYPTSLLKRIKLAVQSSAL